MVSHKPVLLKESIEGLNLHEGSIAVDATLGGGGHSDGMLNILGDKGKLVVFDVDEKAIEGFKISNHKSQITNKSQNSKSHNIYFVHDNFVNIKNALAELKIEKVDAILADLGYSSMQLEDTGIGMSFLQDAPLDMRLDRNGDLTARTVVNTYSQGELGRLIKNFGEERFASIIANAV